MHGVRRQHHKVANYKATLDSDTSYSKCKGPWTIALLHLCVGQFCGATPIATTTNKQLELLKCKKDAYWVLNGIPPSHGCQL